MMRRTGARDSACVHLLGGAGGPLGGDDLSLSIRVGPGAQLTMRSVAAMIAQPDSRRRQSCSVIDVELGEDSVLDWGPQPLIITRQARHQQLTSLKLDARSAVRWRDVTVLGRHGEEAGTVQQRLAAARGGEELLVQSQTWGAGAPRGWGGPAGVAGARVVASVLTVAPHELAPVAAPTTTSATMRVTEGASLRTAIGPDVRSVMRDLDAGSAGFELGAQRNDRV